ncbi:carcinoembryonic antigen-related cell adhesion molecule 1-like isoform X5 [Phyllostomus hastatus]|uniref:carcinoembryonic antigen-related cell adhesion molecule 1-like isoform X5 n=1 Tax=Phyllostomus hastatus TaxID=9423 RepID=UPI001E680A74|nr:carcinoembryonic antigen-related cell adhesion molecule 1-like isoform X5 [Phyllostomus hastatus]
MESLSAPAHRGRVLLQGLLLAVSLLTFGSLPTTARLTVASTNAAEGTDVLLLVLNLPESLFGYNWFRGKSANSSRGIGAFLIDTQKFTPGPAHSGRETIYPNGSLLFQKVTLNDTGYYTIAVTKKDLLPEEATGQLHVYPELPKPSITSNNSNPEEHKDPVLLTCEPHTQDTTYLWLINSQSLQDSARLELSKDNRTLTLLRVTRTDTGPYECETRNPVSAGRSDPFTLNVLYVSTSPNPGLSGGAIAGIVIGVLAVVALTAALVYFLYIRKTGGASDQHDVTEHKPSTSNHSQGHSENSPNKIHEITYSSLNFNAQEAKKPTSASPSPVATEMIYSEVKKK